MYSLLLLLRTHLRVIEMYEADILVILYPNMKEIKAVLIIDPFDKKVEYYSADSLEEAKQILREHLPFCDQGHPPTLHMGLAYIAEWESLPETKLVITRPSDIDSLR